jgi:predicted Zn-dependent peptidase
VPVISLRLSILAADPAGYAGVGHLIQHIIYPSLEDRASRIGAKVSMQRTSDAIIYTATGPAEELPALARLLIQTLQPPETPVDALLRAERDLEEERLAEWETAPSHTRSLLRAQLFPGDLSAAGTEQSAKRMSGAIIRANWAEMYRPDRVSIVAVGDVFLADVEEQFASLPGVNQLLLPAAARDSVSLRSLAPAEATRSWYGRAWQTSDLSPAAVTVTARLLGDLLRTTLPTTQVDVEHWWTRFGQAIVLVVAAPARDGTRARTELDRAVTTMSSRLDATRITATARAVRHEMLFYSRTPDGMADVIGQFIDRDGNSAGTEQFYRELDQVGVDDVRKVLAALRERTPASAEIPPQQLLPPR